MRTVMDDFMHELFKDHNKTVGGKIGAKDLEFCALALCGESGELANVIKKEWRDGEDMELERLKETADVLVYTLLLTYLSGWTWEQLVEMAHHKHQQFMEKQNAKRNN